MKPFAYHKPDSVSAAVALLAAHANAVPLAGGMTLVPTMKQRLAGPDHIVDLSGIAGLSGVSMDGGTLVIGASTRHADVASSELVLAKLPALARLAGRIGDQQVRHRGTIGGSIANNDPAADYPAAVLALGADIVTDRRSIRADDFFIDMFETALEPGEIVTSVRFPLPDAAAYCKFANPASRYALAGVFVAKTGDAVRVAVTGAASAVFRAGDIETALSESFEPSALERISIDASGLMADIHADSEYRAQLVMVMARRAVAMALSPG
ncbi:carbon-monoxide dehydrogenase medium subunit [Hoeflea marina]|uniref:Carbon-monoxide dehydrogenase medium subunit n=1 Tax=Hoeflea marina TaxID=274592 RepID=A0A317PSQ7_9HYPH|nr:xanthine dehydrogenase family protein subunit M [Hoeflea marina]PWW03785.1 carbon-monoxide dehydrogenase medium subunit [Hoeflea marina]